MNRLKNEDIDKALAWGFNCGPSAICAVLDLSPEEVRPHLGDFETKGYTNPTLMIESLKRCGASYRRVYRGDFPGAVWPALRLGVVRVQWGGPWTKPGVPMQARYRQTHWIGMRDMGKTVFDINVADERCDGWIPFELWLNKWAPWICKEGVPKSDGTFWPTHAFEVNP